MSLWIPDKSKDGKRRYGRWAGEPNGRMEDVARCVAQVPGFPRHLYCQCSRKRGHGPDGEFCRQHAKKAGER